MSKTLSFVRLDFITIKPYLTLKNLIIFVGVAFIMGWSTAGSGATIGFFMAYCSLYVTYPFSVGERNGIDTLYSTLSISRGNVVLGRYIFAACLDILSGIFAYVIDFVILTILGKEFVSMESLAVLAALFLTFGFIQLIQLPIYFKLGYSKAKLLAYLPFVGLSAVVFAFNSFFSELAFMQAIGDFFGWISNNPILLAVLCVVVFILLIYISYRLSLSFYKKRDF